MPYSTYLILLASITFGAMIVVLIALSWLWNRRYRPYRLQQGRPTDTFGRIMKRVRRFIFVEETGSIFQKAVKDPSEKPKEVSPAMQKITYKKLYLGLTILIVGCALIAGINHATSVFGIFAIGALLILLLTIWGRTAPIFQSRHKILARMFDVASSQFKYGKGSEMDPWTYVNVQKWDNLIIPADTAIAIPNTYRSDIPSAREAFEAHFSNIVTDENSWDYEWNSVKNQVIAHPVRHLPTNAPYPGSEQFEWDTFPIGEGISGPVSFNVSSVPHTLVAGPTGSGKNLSGNTQVLSRKGWIKIIDLQVGDVIFGADGQPAMVTHLHPIITPKKAFEIKFKNGEKIIVDGDHLWETYDRNARMSQYNVNKKESGRDRKFWLDEDAESRVLAAYEHASNEDTISVTEVAMLAGKHETEQIWYQIAKVVGPAEEVREKVRHHYNTQIVKQNQIVGYIKTDVIMNYYNNIRKLETGKPFTLSQWQKLSQLKTELRPTDKLSAQSLMQYLDSNPNGAIWLSKNMRRDLDAHAMIDDLSQKMITVSSRLPAKIFGVDGDHEYLNARQLSTLLDVDYQTIGRSLFEGIKKHAKADEKFTRRELVELYVPEYTTEKETAPHFKYPKKLFLQHVLEHNATPINDQRHLRSMPQIRTTQEIMDTLNYHTGQQSYLNHSIRKTSALQLQENKLPIAPYVYGAWLGDGASRYGMICGIDNEIFSHIETLGYIGTDKSKIYRQTGKHNDFRMVHFPKLLKELKFNKLSLPLGWLVSVNGDWKHIPDVYLLSSEEQRRELLRGLLDTDGTVGNGGQIQFATSNPRLRTDVKRLVASLGYIPFVSEKQPTYTHEDEKKTGKTAYVVSFQAHPDDHLFHLSRKNAVHRARFTGENLANAYNQAHFIESIREVEPVEMRCISVDAPDRLFLVSDSLIPTHNSVLQRNLLFHCIQHNDVWRFVGIDLKRVELSVYKKYSKTVKAIAVDLETGVELTKQIKDTMMERYTIMENAGVNHFLQLRDEHGQHPKAIMLMVDEAFVFLSPEGAKTDEGKQRDQWHGEAVTLLGEIARLGRAAGIHLIIATQRPDAAVIPGELRSNLENRIAAGRLNTTSSSMILDSGAGTRLPKIKGRGAISVSGEVQQFQGYFAPPNWIDKWLEDHKDREPALFGLPDVEDDMFGDDEEGVDFLPSDQLEFDIDEAARELLMEGKTDFPDMLLPDGELPEDGAAADYDRVTQPPTLVTPEVRAAAEEKEFKEVEDEKDAKPRLFKRRRVQTETVTPTAVPADLTTPAEPPVDTLPPAPAFVAPPVVGPPPARVVEPIPVAKTSPAPKPNLPLSTTPERRIATGFPPGRPNTLPTRPERSQTPTAPPATPTVPARPARPASLPPRFPGLPKNDN